MPFQAVGVSPPRLEGPFATFRDVNVERFFPWQRNYRTFFFSVLVSRVPGLFRILRTVAFAIFAVLSAFSVVRDALDFGTF